MEKFKQLVLTGSAYTVLFALILYIFFSFSGLGENGMGIDKFLLVLGYGMLVAGANLLCSLMKMREIFKNLIHFAILLAGFIVLYILTMGASQVNAGKIFIASFIFLAVYVAVRFAAYGIRRLTGKNSPATPKKQDSKPEKPVYTSRFGNN
ncbi:MAG: hypothetical protein IKC87_06450 [Clostridia bacterium]|nr:hypothetical protein [Clostridia bacterium]